MVAWLSPTCQFFPSAGGGAVAAACAALLALLGAAIALGYGPLRAWIGWPARGRHSDGMGDWGGGLVGTWRLWRAGRGDDRAAGDARQVLGSR